MPIRTVLICTTQVPFTVGGAESHVEGLRSAFERRGFEVAVAAVPFAWNPPREIVRSTMAWRMLNVTEANGRRIDLVVAMKFPAYIVEHPNKVLWILHQHRSAYNLRGTEYDDLSTHPDGATVRAFIKQCDDEHIPAARKVFANSRTVSARLKQFNGIDSEPLYHPPPLATALHEGEADDYVLYPGRLESQKRQQLLVDALRHTRTPVRLVLAGSTQDRGHVADLVKAAGLSDRVTLTGRVSDTELAQLYSRALAAAYVPFDEDLGYVPLEAMRCAKPVMTTDDAGGGSEFVEEGVTGYVVPPRAEAIAERLDALFDDRAHAARLGRAGRERYATLDLSWDHVVDRLIEAGS